MKQVPLSEQLAMSTVMTNLKKQSNMQKHPVEKKYPCLHDIVIFLGYQNNKPIYRCMFCQTRSVEDINFDHCILIDASNYYKEVLKMNNEQEIEHKLALVRNEIVKVIQYTPGITNGQLECMINQSLNGYSYQKKYHY